MCYEDIKVSFIVESEFVRQGNWERAESGSRKDNAGESGAWRSLRSSLYTSEERQKGAAKQTRRGDSRDVGRMTASNGKRWLLDGGVG